MANKDDFVRYTIRLPKPLYDRVQAHADENNRSVNGEVNSLLEIGLWEADWSRMENGLEPLREMDDNDRQFLEHCRDSIKRHEENKKNPRSVIADIDIPLFIEGPTQREFFEKITSRLERIEDGIQEVIQNSVDAKAKPILGDEPDPRIAHKNKP